MEGSNEDSPGNMHSQSSAALLRAARRKTDLMPTIPSSSPRDITPSNSRPSSATRRTPGRAFSMSRLDVLATPRQPAKRQIQPLPEQKPLSDNSMSRSMSHLAVRSNLRRSDTTRSMMQLGPPLPPPRPTRAERLRRRAREVAASNAANSHGKFKLFTFMFLPLKSNDKNLVYWKLWLEFILCNYSLFFCGSIHLPVLEFSLHLKKTFMNRPNPTPCGSHIQH